jgi:predicted RNA polymerase sigma factor
MGAVGPYQLQAAIAALHDEAASLENTDWRQILAFYELLKCMSDNPMVALSHAIALAMVNGPTAGLALLTGLDKDGRLSGHHRLHAVRAHLFEMARDYASALQQYQAAIARTASLPERNYLLSRAARLNELAAAHPPL